MILEYGICNFLSFKEGAKISFRLDGKVPSSISNGRDYSNILLVKGANASGKTHLLKGLAFISSFILHSFASDVKDLIAVEPFGKSNQPSSFYVEFRINNEDYRYELDVEPKQVLREVLYRKKKRKIKIVERINDQITYSTDEFSEIKRIKLRKNASFISTAAQYEIEGIDPILVLFQNIRFNVTSDGFRESDFIDIAIVCEALAGDEEARRAISDILAAFDTGISDIKIIEEESTDGKGKRYYPLFLHKSGNESIWVRLNTESSGTKQLFRHLLGHLLTLRNGGLLILDEFDMYLHPHLLERVLDLYINPETNKNNAQLYFTSHQNCVIDICGRYRTYLVAKEDNVSYAYRLDEIPGDILRNDRSISPYYDEGRIGGVPRL